MNMKSLIDDVFSRTQSIIDKHGPRLAGTTSCLATGDDLYDELNDFADEAHRESFFVYQGAFLGWIRILVLCYMFGMISLWLNQPLIAFVLAIISLLILTLQFFLYLPLLDKLYPKKKAQNVYGVIHPTDEVKQQVIISGHHDSAHVFNFFIHQPKLYNLRTTGSIALVIMLTLLSLVLVFIQDIVILTLSVKILVSLGALLVGQMWFFSSQKAAPGAGDNLVASSIALSLGKHYKKLRDQGKGLKHTKLILMSFDAEEEGLRGARAYAKKHEDMFKQTKTYLLNMDCLYDENELFFLTSDLNNFVKLDQALAEQLVDIGKSVNASVKTQPLAFLTGGTDAAELAKKGVHATTIIGMPWTNQSRSNVYHTPHDTLDKVSPKVVEHTIAIYDQFIQQLDQT